MLVILILEEVPGCENGSTSVLLLSEGTEDFFDEIVDPKSSPADIDEEDDFLALFPLFEEVSLSDVEEEESFLTLFP